MGTDAITKVRDELDRAFDRTRAELDRVEILAAGLAAFNAPFPATNQHSIICASQA